MTAVQHIPRKELSQFFENDLEFIYDQSKLKDFIGLPFQWQILKTDRTQNR